MHSIYFILMISKFWVYLFSLLLGVLLTFAFAPFHFAWLGLISLTGLLLLWKHYKHAGLLGFCFGIGFFGFGVSWVFVSIHEFGNTHVLLAGVITTCFIFILSLFPALNGFLFKKYFNHSHWMATVAFPTLWILLEWFRSWLFTGFPWLLIGHSQLDTLLRGYIPIFGVFGVGWLFALTSGMIVYCIDQKSWARVKCLMLLSLIWIIGFYLQRISWVYPLKSIEVSLIQGNVSTALKWNPNYVHETLEKYLSLTDRHWRRLVIWPEASIPVLDQMARPFLKQLDQQAKIHGTTLLAGIPIQKESQYFNGLLSLGLEHGEYLKRHLVILGEYLPDWLVWLSSILKSLEIPMSDFSAGKMQQIPLKVSGFIVAPFICYEIAYNDLVRAALPQSNLLITINDDAWFGQSFALAQHLQIGQFQALASGRPLLFLSNTGLTAVVSEKGYIQKEIKPFISDTLTTSVRFFGGDTPWRAIGDPLIIAIMFGLLITTFFLLQFASSNKVE